MKTNIKICGITNVPDAMSAIHYGATFIGLIFAHESPRRISADVACQISNAVGGQAQVVGVFQDNPLEEIQKTLDEINVDYVQFHGNESAEMCDRMPVRVIKTFNLDERFDWTLPDCYKSVVAGVLFDRPKSHRDDGWMAWAISSLIEHRPKVPYFFAGGLHSSNVQEVVVKLRPYGVDVASSIEQSPGIKDLTKMKTFCEAVKTVVLP